MADLGGASVMIAVSMRARPTENALTARCDQGTVRANLFHGYATIERGRPSRLDKLGRPFLASAQAYSDPVLTLMSAFIAGCLFATATLDEQLAQESTYRVPAAATQTA